MRRSKVAILVFAVFLVIAGLVLGLYFGFAQGPHSPAVDPNGPKGPNGPNGTEDPFDPKEMARRCAVAGVTQARCADTVGEYGMEGTAMNFDNDVRECRKKPDPAQVQSCILDNFTRDSSFKDVFDGPKGSAVYPQNYASLTLSVGSMDLARGTSDQLALVASGSPLLVMRFMLEGARHSIRTADGKSAVYVAANGALSIGDISTVTPALFDVRGTGVPNTIHVAPVETRDAKLWYASAASAAASTASTASTAFVTMRLDRRNGLNVNVGLDGTWLAAQEYGFHREFITDANNASCCDKLISGCQLDAKVQFPLCCKWCNDTLPTCAWKASIDAGVDDSMCCLSWSTLPNAALDYNSCTRGSGSHDPPPPATLQYALKCDPTPDHTFAFVPSGVWDLAPSGVRLPAYGRVAQMRIAGAGFRGVRCSSIQSLVA